MDIMTREIGLRKVALPNGLTFFDVIMTITIDNGEGFHNESQAIVDSHWQESTSRECAKRWAKFYDCPLSIVPISGGIKEFLDYA